ncbi:MAG: hypothetical protein IT210_08585 [Armatimonadetes bacterium]|nr:hypothetical protein [Armatimonadota bacterium]
MPDISQWKMNPDDLAILHSLARRKLEIAHDPVNLERKRLWHALDEDRAEKPMVLAESWVAYDDLPDSKLSCREDWARGLEAGFRYEIFQFEKIGDDHVVEPWINCNWHVSGTDCGVEVKTRWAERVSGNISSRQWDYPIKDIRRDLDRLRPRGFRVDREASLAWKAHLEEAFAGLLPVRIRGGFFWSAGMTWPAIELIGLENMMRYMYTEPESLHRLMAFLRDDCLAHIDWLEKEDLLSLNNENDYIGSGSMGYSRALPQGDNGSVKPGDMWVLSESQETVSVSPQMFEEFVFQYQLPVIERFGRCYYGCCEPVHTRWNVLKKIPNLKRVSISPWCDEEFMAREMGRDYVFSRKPNPTLISTERFDEEAIRSDIRKTLRAAAGCNVEIIMKDVHTLCGRPERMARWVELTRQTIEEI